MFQHQREKSFIDEHRCFLHHFLAKRSLSDRPGLDVRAGFWPESLFICLSRDLCTDRAERTLDFGATVLQPGWEFQTLA